MVSCKNMPRFVVAYITKSQTEKIRIMEKDVYGQENLNGCVEDGSKKVDLEKNPKGTDKSMLPKICPRGQDPHKDFRPQR